MPARKPKTDEKPQSERFIETAREIGASENADDFEQVFRDVVPPRVPDGGKPKDKDQA
jgi:hypothetical protein